MLLTEYLTNVRDLLNDELGNFYSTAKLTRYINRARKQTAKIGECVRVLPPSTASVLSITVTNPGSGYTSGSVTIAGPDANGPNFVTAVAAPTFGGGQLTSITVNVPGSGYVAVPQVTITGNGSGATAMAVLTPHVFTVVGQEVYNIADVAAIITSLMPGVESILGIQGISCSWGAQKPTLQRSDFSAFQAWLRSWQGGMQGPPAAWAQVGQGVTGNIYLWPVPTQVNRMDWDCYCSVADLVGTTIPDVIPEPWDEPVTYYAAMLAYQGAQRPDDARGMQAEFQRLMLEARAAVTTPMVPNFYPDGNW